MMGIPNTVPEVTEVSSRAKLHVAITLAEQWQRDDTRVTQLSRSTRDNAVYITRYGCHSTRHAVTYVIYWDPV
jgi:hypothetical protein